MKRCLARCLAVVMGLALLGLFVVTRVGYESVLKGSVGMMSVLKESPELHSLFTNQQTQHNSSSRTVQLSKKITLEVEIAEEILPFERVDRPYEGAPAMNGTCRKNNHFVMIKTEKTGSSTLFGILARYIMSNKLNVMVMTIGGHLDVSRSRGESPGWDIGPRRRDRADTLIHHARYNKTLLDNVTHADTQYITLVRDAASWFSSAIRFWPGQVKFLSPDQVLNTTDRLYMRRAELKDEYNGQETLLHLSQLQWLGFDYKKHKNMTDIKQYIKDIVPRFNLGFLTDQFDASLILLRRQFCWEHSDLFYKSQEVGGRQIQKASSATPLSPEGRAKLLTAEVNLGDQLLYEAFNKTWWERLEVKSNDFWEEVAQFKKSNDEVQERCRRTTQSFTLPANKWSVAVTITRDMCKGLYLDNYALIKQLARYAIGADYEKHAKRPGIQAVAVAAALGAIT